MDPFLLVASVLILLTPLVLFQFYFANKMQILYYEIKNGPHSDEVMEMQVYA